MGEYIKHAGKDIKLGTCEDLYYARFEQLQQERTRLQQTPGNLNADGYLDPDNGFRYRFPFPDEDKIEMGYFEEYSKGLTFHVPSIGEIDHREICCSASHGKFGYNINVMFPCVQSAHFATSGIKTSRRDRADHIIELIQQKQVDGLLVPVFRCFYCDAGFRFSVDELIEHIARWRAEYAHDKGNGSYRQEVLNRMEAGLYVNEMMTSPSFL